MNYQCPRCFHAHQVGPDDRRLPPWCPKCGADVKHEEWLPILLPPPPPEPARFDGGEVTSVTSTGPRPWLNKPPAPTAPPPEPEPAPPLPTAATTAEIETAVNEVGRALLFVSLVGVVVLAAAALLAVRVQAFVQDGRKTTGEVVAVWKPAPNTFGVIQKHHVLQYEVNGTKYELPPDGRGEGTRVPIVYPPTNPGDGRVNTPGSMYFWAIVVGALGLALLAGSLIGSRLLPDRPEPTAEDGATHDRDHDAF